jgi:hypothetical protein
MVMIIQNLNKEPRLSLKTKPISSCLLFSMLNIKKRMQTAYNIVFSDVQIGEHFNNFEFSYFIEIFQGRW